MAFDGITIAALSVELKNRILHAHIRKIAQPEPDELLLTLQTPAGYPAVSGEEKKRETLRLKLSANASLPLFYLTEENKPSPLTAPNFCMLLRKHLSGARIEDVEQIGMERVVRFRFSTKNELGDDISCSLVIEIMGKHSNLIFLDADDMIIDSIKHVNSLMSSVREVLPGKPYFVPNTMDKLSPFTITTEEWNSIIFPKPESTAKAISGGITGISRIVAYELCNRAGVDGDCPTASLNGNERSAIMNAFRELMERIKESEFSPSIYYDNKGPREFSVFPLTILKDCRCESDVSPSMIVERFYREKETLTRIRFKSSDLKNSVQTHYDRCIKKLDILRKQLKDTEKKDRFQVYGELITTYGYTELPPLPMNTDLPDDGKLVLHCTNYHNGEEIDIPIDPSLSVSENANKYFEKYNKLKRTYEAVTVQLEESQNERDHLESVLNELSIARQEEDLIAIRAELTDHGYLKKQSGSKSKGKQLPKSKPLHFISSDGFDIYVGKNNYQNEELTFKKATGNDWWFHAKQMPGSHVIVSCHGEEPPIHTFEEAASLAALFSRGKLSEKLEIDYTQKKNVKKPGGGKPGFVVYYTNYSIVASEEHLKRVTPAGQEEAAYL